MNSVSRGVRRWSRAEYSCFGKERSDSGEIVSGVLNLHLDRVAVAAGQLDLVVVAVGRVALLDQEHQEGVGVPLDGDEFGVFAVADHAGLVDAFDRTPAGLSCECVGAFLVGALPLS